MRNFDLFGSEKKFFCEDEKIFILFVIDKNEKKFFREDT